MFHYVEIKLAISYIQLWKSYIKRPMTLVGPSLGAAVAVDFAVNYPEAVSILDNLEYDLFSI